MDGVEVRVTSWHDPEGQALRARQLEETLASWPDEPIPASSMEEFPIVVILSKSGSSIACGGLQPLGGGAAEIKRVYVVPQYRGREQGVADLLLLQLECKALEHGLTTLKLETGVMMKRARAWYERNGFTEIPLFGPYVGATSSVCYEKRLAFASDHTAERNDR
ncbi:uncharacterized protein MYCFIDRAFT_79315 [Pseudocercospora fijiensis CIRAD86]|uniref:N-acetyltransferase domain-containing protein n=1 Tax=Pseudocercospora fijiensis (strain CIRAD86) TaxID=383855 RepID=M2YK01_PSEFD|nr:uncharacterized protein MYCFIDRAFT_79315 [Pseudocercospora fijiensis CIRAD86]EME78090.1 hypothetical protein MYCFIDRAFT_79315 [Pseudocercospora fijiensis CIRAD86]